MKWGNIHLTEALVRSGQHWQTQKEKEAREPCAAPKFTIALSRQVGARGTSVARVIGARMGWPVYDRELLEEIGKTMKVRADLLKSVDERRVTSMQECIEALMTTTHVRAGAYFRHLLDTLLSLGLHGECIIVGRGAPQVLPPDTTLRVRLVGKIEDRIAVMMKELDVNAAQAGKHIESTDLERTRFVREHFHKDPTDPLQYDLVLNSSRFSNEECASVIVQALQQLQQRMSAKSSPRETESMQTLRTS
jgi:cytidylate kinase